MTKASLESRVADFIRRHGLLPPNETVVVAVSGGPDSVCLLHILAGLRQELDIDLHVAHLNHQLRGPESEAEARYVSDLARSLGLPATISAQDAAAHRTARNCSLEEAARELRYAFLARVAADAGATRVATGHTRDDQVETVLMHILRGTGTAGLGGLAPCTPLPHHPTMKPHQGISKEPPPGPGAQLHVPLRGRAGAEPPLPVSSGDLGTQPPVHASLPAQQSDLLLIRPLLEVTREETAGYCQQHGLHPCLDSSNLSLSFLRNRLRLELLPLLRQYNPAIDDALLRLAGIAREDSAFIAGQASALWQQVARQEDEAIYLDRRGLAALPAALQRQILRTALALLSGDARDIEAVHIEAARSLLHKPAGKEVSLPHGLVCRAGYDELTVARASAKTSPGSSAEALGEVSSGGEPHPFHCHCESRHVGTKQSQRPWCAFPALSGEMPLRAPGQTPLPGWRVTAAIVPQVPQGTDESHCEPQPIGACQSPEVFARPPGGPLPPGLPRHPHSIGTPRNDGEECHPHAFVATFDLARTGTDLFVRTRRPGDRFQPLGMSMPKKVQDFMVDARIPRAWRAHIPIVCSPWQIVWVVGWRIDDRVKVTEASQEVLRLEFVRSE